MSSRRPRRFLADEAACVDVDGDERLRLVDDDRAARLQPDLAAKRPIDLRLDAASSRMGAFLVVELHPGGKRRHDAINELAYARRYSSSLSMRIYTAQQIAKNYDQALLLIHDDRARDDSTSGGCRSRPVEKTRSETMSSFDVRPPQCG